MTLLITIFVSALVGVVFIVGFKLAEERLGRPLFLPEWLLRRDEAIERSARFYTRAILWWVKHRVFIVFHVVYHGARGVLREAVQRTHFRPSGKLEKNGSASVYLKQMAEHKEAARRENGHAE